MSPEQRLWQSVVVQAVVDAHRNEDVQNGVERRAKREAVEWLTEGRKDFRHVCALAGFDPEFVRSAFLEGRIDMAVLRAPREFGRGDGPA